MNNLEETQELFNKASPRELEIVRDMSDGLSNKEIATKYNVSVHTVETHRHRILKKTKCRNGMHLVATFLRTGIIV